MNEKEFERYFNRLKVQAYLKIKNSAPYRTGALSRAIKIRNNIDGFSILSPIPYMKYTEEPWRSDFTRDGRKNPNLYWLKEATEKIVDKIRSELNG